MVAIPSPSSQLVYPDSDGQPMADNTRQFEWIVTIKKGLDWLFINDPNVFVAGDHLWYPVEGRPDIRVAPDAMVVLGRPKGERGSYQQWLEDNLPPQVVFEVLSPGNTFRQMLDKLRFYERYGVQEYYLYDPDRGTLEGFQRQGAELQSIESMQGWESPLLKIRFGLAEGELQLFHPGGERFETYTEVATRANQEHQRAEQEHQRAEQERQRAEQEHQRAEQECQRAERLAERLRQIGLDPDQP